MKSFLRLSALGLALTAGLFAAGCNDDNDNVTTPQTPATPAPAPTPTPTPEATPTPTGGPAPGATVSFLGEVRAIENGLIKVDNDNVVVDATTKFQREDLTPISMAQIQVGDVVRVKGTYNEDASALVADKVTLLP
jgi:hypothetical protein